MNPTQQDPAYEYCLGSEALQKWGPKTKDMELSDHGDWISVNERGTYNPELLYRRKRQTPVQDGEEWQDWKWTASNARFPIWLTDGQKVVLVQSQKELSETLDSFCFWKPAKLPAPPKPKQKTQKEIDDEAIDGMLKSAAFCDEEATKAFWFREGFHAALAWERSQGKEDGK